jgi:hypothetical protein
VGVTTITWNVSDVNGNAATEVIQNITVNDIQAPVITCPANINTTIEFGQTGKVITYDLPTAIDNCGISSVDLVSGLASGEVFPIGETVVTYRATDNAGNTSDCSFMVTIKESADNENPVINDCPSDITVSSDPGKCSALVTWTVPSASDNSGSVSMSSNFELGSIFPVGTTPVVYTATDDAGNQSICSFDITVTDTQTPVITTSGDQTVDPAEGLCEATVEVSADATDNCSVGEPEGIRSDGLALSDPYPVGVTTIAWNVSDVNGNAATEVFQTITVNDTQEPIVITQDLLIELNEGEIFTLSPAQIYGGSFDNCGQISLSLDKTEFSEADEGANLVTLFATDASGNSASAQATVTVIVNREPSCEVVAIANDITLSLDKNGFASLTTNQVNNGSFSNCANGPLTLSLSKESFGCSDLGVQEVTLTATDRDGNTGSTQFLVTVVDNLAPSIVKTPKSLSVNLPENGSFSLQDFRSLYPASDNCEVVEFVQSPAPGTIITEVGTYQITLTAWDASGNSTGASFDLVVRDSGTKGGGKGKNKSIDSNSLLTVAWNTPFEELKDYTWIVEEEDELFELEVDWNEKDYNPLIPGFYQIEGILKSLEYSKIISERVHMMVVVLDKPKPTDIILSNTQIAKDLVSGSVIGEFYTQDPVDQIHFYHLESDENFELIDNQLVWIGSGKLLQNYSLIVSSTDRVGQTISKEIYLQREPGSNQMTVYPNPAHRETNIKVDLGLENQVTIRIFESTGRLVFEESQLRQKSFEKKVDLDGLSSGLYQVQVQIGFEVISKILIKNQ